MYKNNNALCWASESRKQNLSDRTLDLPLSFRLKHITSLKKTSLRRHQVRILPHYWFQGNFAATFVLNYRLRELPLSAVTNRFELRCEPKQLMLLYY